MTSSKKKVTTRKQHAENLKDLNTLKANAREKEWLKGHKTSMEKDILAAGEK
jgi:hypothetical protein